MMEPDYLYLPEAGAALSPGTCRSLLCGWMAKQSDLNLGVHAQLPDTCMQDGWWPCPWFTGLHFATRCRVPACKLRHSQDFEQSLATLFFFSEITHLRFKRQQLCSIRVLCPEIRLHILPWPGTGSLPLRFMDTGCFSLLQPPRALTDLVYSLNTHTLLIIWKDYQNLESD